MASSAQVPGVWSGLGGVPLDGPIEAQQGPDEGFSARDMLRVAGEVPVPLRALEEGVPSSQVLWGEGRVGGRGLHIVRRAVRVSYLLGALGALVQNVNAHVEEVVLRGDSHLRLHPCPLVVVVHVAARIR